MRLADHMFKTPVLNREPWHAQMSGLGKNLQRMFLSYGEVIITYSSKINSLTRIVGPTCQDKFCGEGVNCCKRALISIFILFSLRCCCVLVN